MFSVFVLLIVFNLCASEPVSVYITPDHQGYLSSPVGFGPGTGARFWGSVRLATIDNSPIFGLSQLVVLTDQQHGMWSKSFSSWQTQTSVDDDGQVVPEDVLVDGSSMVSFYHSIFLDEADFDLNINLPTAERFFVVILFPSQSQAIINASTKIFGTLSLDWDRAADELPRLMYQYRFLDKAVMVMAQLLTIFLVWYIVAFLIIRRSSTTKLHWFYLLSFSLALGYLLSWYQAIVLEGSSGDRSSFWSKWLPSTYQKFFDIMETLMYLLTSLGWQTLRPSLSTNEIQMISAGALVSLLLGLVEIKCSEDSIQCTGITSARMIVHMFGYLTVIVAFNYNLAVLREMLSQSSVASYDTGRLYKHFRNFHLFRNVFFAFIVQPTVAVILRADLIGWGDDWIFVSFFWGSKIFLLAALAVVFRPNPGLPSIVDFAVKARRRAQRDAANADYPAPIPVTAIVPARN